MSTTFRKRLSILFYILMIASIFILVKTELRKWFVFEGKPSPANTFLFWISLGFAILFGFYGSKFRSKKNNISKNKNEQLKVLHNDHKDKEWCNKCGVKLLPNTKFCMSCGAEIESVKKDFKIKKKVISEDKIVITVVLFIVFMVIAVLLFFNASNNSPMQKNNLKNSSKVSSSYYAKKKIQTTNNEKIKCTGNIADLQKVGAGSYKFYNKYEAIDFDLMSDSNEMKLIGIIKNNNLSCKAYNIKLKITIMNSDYSVAQEEIVSIDKNVKFRKEVFDLVPLKSNEYKTKITVFSTLLNTIYGRKKLKDGLTVYVQIDSADWLPVNKK